MVTDSLRKSCGSKNRTKESTSPNGLLSSELWHSVGFSEKKKEGFKSVHEKKRGLQWESAVSFLSTSSSFHSNKNSNAAHEPRVSAPDCTSTSWPRIHLSLTQDTFLMALLLPRWRTVSKRATRDLGKDTASKSQPAHSHPVAVLRRTQYCSHTERRSGTKVHPVLSISTVITVIFTPGAENAEKLDRHCCGSLECMFYICSAV